MPITEVRSRDPLRNYQFSIYVQTLGRQWTGIGGVQRVSGLTCLVSGSETWEGGNNLHRYTNPDRVTWEPVTLEQGMALDRTLETWAEAVRHFAMTGRVMRDPETGGSVPVKRSVVIEVSDPITFSDPMKEAKPQPPRVRRYRIQNAWISKYVALPKFDALATEVALISVELQHEGWTIDFAREKTESTPQT